LILERIKPTMIYKVTAKIIEDKVGEFYLKLTDGTIANQRPDGEEIVASMKRAVLTDSGLTEWYEVNHKFCIFAQGLVAYRTFRCSS